MFSTSPANRCDQTATDKKTDTPITTPVCGQCKGPGGDKLPTRDAENAVYCSCRCGVAEGGRFLHVFSPPLRLIVVGAVQGAVQGARGYAQQIPGLRQMVGGEGGLPAMRGVGTGARAVDAARTAQGSGCLTMGRLRSPTSASPSSI